MTVAGGVGEGIIGETGTGCGVGLAWLVSGACPGVRLVSIERDAALVETARTLFADAPAVTVLHGDWRQLRAVGPFDLLALDGGGQGKSSEPPIEPGAWLRPGGLVVMDDFTPTDGWPPLHDGGVDQARLHWLQHPQLLAAEVRTQPDAATVIATFPGKSSGVAAPGTDARGEFSDVGLPYLHSPLVRYVRDVVGTSWGVPPPTARQPATAAA